MKFNIGFPKDISFAYGTVHSKYLLILAKPVGEIKSIKFKRNKFLKIKLQQEFGFFISRVYVCLKKPNIDIK